MDQWRCSCNAEDLKRRPTSGAPMNHLDLHSPLGAKYDVTRDIGIVLGTCSPYESTWKLLVSVYVRLFELSTLSAPLCTISALRDACAVSRGKCIWRRERTLLNRDVGHFSCFRASLWNLSRLEARGNRVY